MVNWSRMVEDLIDIRAQVAHVAAQLADGDHRIDRETERVYTATWQAWADIDAAVRLGKAAEGALEARDEAEGNNVA